MDNFWIIGDVAGEFDALMELIEKLPKDAKLVFVGDLNDRGPKSKEVIEWVKNSGHIALLGNHEHMFIDYIKSRIDPSYSPQYDSDIFLYNGGVQTLKSYLGRPTWRMSDNVNEDLKVHLDWLDNLPLFFETEDVIVTHAPIFNSDIGGFKNMSKFDAVWNRHCINPNKKFQFFGHNGKYHRFQDRDNEYNSYAICVDDSHNKNLTAVNWPSLEKIQVKFK